MVLTIAELQADDFPQLLEEAAQTFLEADDYDVEAYERRANEAQRRHDDAYWAAWNRYSGLYDDFQDALLRAIEDARPTPSASNRRHLAHLPRRVPLAKNRAEEGCKP